MKKFELAMQTGLVPRASDTGKDITLRNASEHKRLEGHLKHLDHQLRSKLVSMQAEIMELKASQYGMAQKHKKRSPRLLESRDRANSDGRLHQRRGRPRTFTTDQLPNPNDSPSVPLSSTALPDQKDNKNELLLPEINPKQTSLVGNTTKSSTSDRNSFPSLDSSKKKKTKSGGLSPVDNVLLNIPSPPSIYRPNSLPELSRLGSNNHGGGGVSPRSTRRVQFTLPESKSGQNNASPTDNHKEPVEGNSTPSEPQNTLAERVNDFIKQTETTKMDAATENLDSPAIQVTEVEKDGTEDATKNIDDNDIFYNSMLAKASMENDGLENAPDLSSLGFMDFNDVIDKRLKQTQEEMPSEDEMRKIRYLRWRHEAPQLDLVKTVFEKHNDLDIDGINAQDLNVNDCKPRSLSDNDKDNRLSSSES